MNGKLYETIEVSALWSNSGKMNTQKARNIGFARRRLEAAGTTMKALAGKLHLDMLHLYVVIRVISGNECFMYTVVSPSSTMAFSLLTVLKQVE